MTADEINKVAIPHLAGQFERGLPVLFTGSGFSRGAKNVAGQPIPLVAELKESLWKLCFPSKSRLESTGLEELYDYALIRHRAELSDLLTRILTVDSDSVPDWYAQIYQLAWFRTYTLNVDDLANAVQRSYKLPRKLDVLSATSANPPDAGDYPVRSNTLDVIHLNGNLQDLPGNVTFSITQYAQRLARQEPWYVKLTSELLTHCFVFVGTQLDESPLWQHLELRRARGSRELRELRPRSYLVTPTLNPAREALLDRYNIAWIPMSSEELWQRVLSQMSKPSESGLGVLSQISAPSFPRVLGDVALLAVNPEQKTEYLVGAEPVWADIQSGRAIERSSDERLWDEIDVANNQKPIRGLVVFTGTAGSGKSTALMRMCLRLTAQGVKVGWVDREEGLSPREIKVAARASDAPTVLGIDDADIYGSELSALVREISTNAPYPLLIVAIRSGRLDKVIKLQLLQDIPLLEFTMPHLADEDIDSLIDVLDHENRLGLLQGKSRGEQRRTFREHAGRQLLVAMIKATSGKELEEKAIEELVELETAAARVYGLVAVASAFRLGLSRDEILPGTGDMSNTTLNELDRLLRRNILRVGRDGTIWTRHRLIADIISNEIQKTGQIRSMLSGLAHIAAAKVSLTMRRSARPWRILRAMINHDFLIRAVGRESGRNLYGELENLLNWDSQYWLQRGSLEVEQGDLARAENFLNQAKGLAPEDPYVDTEQAYLWFAQAIERPNTESARSLASDATSALGFQIQRWGRVDPYPYHILGSQGLAWARRGIHSSVERERYLRMLINNVQDGCSKHPRAADLKQLLTDLKEAHLNISVPRQ